ncbi:hypothetical protein F4859DRAFT_473907 [Xylaria cf. heliscus]|nr:hypothetical protein F4859DRAFT_473907 [Xylaria cf. heliscus]
MPPFIRIVSAMLPILLFQAGVRRTQTTTMGDTDTRRFVSMMLDYRMIILGSQPVRGGFEYRIIQTEDPDNVTSYRTPAAQVYYDYCMEFINTSSSSCPKMDLVLNLNIHTP